MAIDYHRMQATATRLLSENGRDFTLIRYNGGTTVADGSDTKGAAQDHIVTGVTVPWSDSQLNSSTIKASDIQLKIDAANIEPLPSDKIDVDGVVHGVVSINKSKPSDVVIAYFLQLRA